MNTTTGVVGGIIIIVLIGIGAFILFGGLTTSPAVTTPTATSTTVANTGQTPTPTPGTGAVQTAGAPFATTNATVAPTDTTAVVTGTVVPGGAITTYWYEYGTTPTLGSKTSKQIIGSGYVAIPTPGYMTGLTKSTTYYFRLVAENQYGQAAGAQNTVMTTQGTPAPIGSLPTVKSLAASGISKTSANLLAQVNPNKAPTQYWFEYGKNGTLGKITTFVSAGSGSATLSAAVPVTNLDQGTTYYYRIDAQNEFGTVNGAILTFKTLGSAIYPVPVVTTQVPSSVATTTATVFGTVNPYGTQTTYWFEYSTDSQLSRSIKTTSQKSGGAGSGTVSVQADLSRLTANTTYYVRTVAQNAGGTARGDIQSFKTK